MAGYKSSGGWMDVTSNIRNEVVFEGRNKDYGAYFIRKNYRHAIFVALGVATTIMAISIGVPLILKLLNIKKAEEVINIKANLIKPPPATRIIKPPPPPLPKLPPSKPLNTILKVTPPIIATMPDSTATAKDISKANPGTDNKIGKDNNAIIPPTVPNTPTEDNNPEQLFLIVQVKPQFPGDINKWLADNTEYPQEAIDVDMQGTVYVSFVVEKDGSVSQVRIKKGINNALDNEAVKVISSMPKWTPGQQNGHAVRVQFSIPVTFVLH